MQVDIREFKSFDLFKANFLSKIPKEYFKQENENSCWNWILGKNSKGYGKLNWDCKSYLVYRISYLIFNGFIPQGKVIRHICNNRACINHRHLAVDTQTDNAIDMVKDNNQGSQKLNEEAIKVIKWFLKYKYKRGLITKLSKLYHVKIATISAIKQNKIWSWVKV